MTTSCGEQSNDLQKNILPHMSKDFLDSNKECLKLVSQIDKLYEKVKKHYFC